MQWIPLCLMFLLAALMPIPQPAEECRNIPNEEEVALYQQANCCLRTLQNELERFLDHRKELIQKDEEYLRATGQWEETLDNEKRLKMTLKTLHTDFLTFRKSVHRAIFDCEGNCGYCRSLMASSALEASAWYAQHLYSKLFPEGWKIEPVEVDEQLDCGGIDQPSDRSGASMEKQAFKGVFAAALTPLHSDFSCDHEALFLHCSDLIQRGCKGIVLFGTTGEGPAFSIDERNEAVRMLIEKGIDPQKIIVGIITPSLCDAQSLAKTAMERRCAAVLIMPPFYFKNPSEAGVIEFYRQTLAAIAGSDLKVILYHFPALSGIAITPNMIQTLRKEFPNNVIGLKDSGGDLGYTMEMIKAFPDLHVFVGNESQIPAAVQGGAAGSISGIANLYPELICSLYAQGIDPSKPDATQTIVKIAKALHQYPLFPAIKSCMASVKGSPWRLMRPPLMALDEAQRKELQKRLLSD